MSYTSYKSYTSYGAYVVTVALLVLGATTYAQLSPPQLILTWHARSYVPADFRGKALPTANSIVTATAMLVDKGAVVDLSKQTVYWYLDDNFISGGIGVTDVIFKTSNFPSGAMELRAELPTYGGKGVIKSVGIPIVPPEVTIEAPLPAHAISHPPARVHGQPYFFNIAKSSDLAYSWTVNDETPSGAENPDTLTINLPSNAPDGFELRVGLGVRVPGGDLLSAAADRITLTFQP